VAILIGTDEAGYGPNFGPLLIAATAWRLPEPLDGEALYERLSSVISPTMRGAADRVVIGDSKRVYKSGGDWRHLERAVFSMLDVAARSGEATNANGRIASWRDLWRHLSSESISCFDQTPWYADFDMPLPTCATADELTSLTESLDRCFSETEIRPVAITARAIFPAEFNRLLAHYGSKGVLLSTETLMLARSLLDRLDSSDDSQSTTVICDKHGGRDRYSGLLMSTLDGSFPEAYEEGRQRSRYTIDYGGRPIEFRFQMKGESEMPVALASLVAKYLRETAMRALNAFWCERIPGLEPTAGYPQDAKRYWVEIESHAADAGIDRAMLWREK